MFGCLDWQNFSERKDLPEKTRETVVGGPSIVFSRTAIVDVLLLWKSTNLCVEHNSLALLYVSFILTHCVMKWWLVSILNEITRVRRSDLQHKLRSSESIVFPIFTETWPDFNCWNESKVTTVRQKNIENFKLQSLSHYLWSYMRFL